MNKVVSKEVYTRVLPLLAVLGLGFTACGGDTNKLTTEEQATNLHEGAVEICTKEADTKFAEKYPEIVVNSNPSVEELQEALENAQGRETEGPATLQADFDDCMDREFNGPMQRLIDEDINMNPTTIPAETTVVTVEG